MYFLLIGILFAQTPSQSSPWMPGAPVPIIAPGTRENTPVETRNQTRTEQKTDETDFVFLPGLGDLNKAIVNF